MSKKYKVIIRKCEDYADTDTIRGIIRDGLQELGEKPHGKILLKPNLIFAHRQYGRFGFTEPRVVESIIDVMGAMPDVERITIGERTGVTFPTRYTFDGAGYKYLRKKPKVKVCFFDEAQLVTFPLKKGTLHQSFELARELVEADYKIWAPKLKHHASTKITHTLKLNIGILNASERLNGHDYRLEEKIADLYEAGHPNLIVSDSIIIGQQGEVVPKPLHLGVIMMSNNGIAIDSVGARIIGIDPGTVNYLRIARERGWPPESDDDIEIIGDVSLEQLQEKTRDFDRSFYDLEALDTPIRFYFGNRPGGDIPCDNGCANMLKTCLAIMDAYHPGALKQSRPIAVVMGEYEGDVDAEGGPILLIGDCTKIGGKVTGKTKRVKGCPVIVPFFMNYGAYYFKVPNPYLDPRELVVFPYQYMKSWAYKIKNRGLLKADFLG